MNERQYDICLKEFLNNNFNLSEMRNMVDDLRVYDRSADPENFPQNKNSFSLELVQYLRRRGLTVNFIDVVSRYLSRNVESMPAQINNIARQRGFK